MDPNEFDDIDEDMPFELMENAELAKIELLPIKSREKYYRIYNHFKDWQHKHGVKNVSSTLILSYFYELEKKKYKPTSLWAYYSMLKATLRVKEDTDIGKYSDVTAFLKVKSHGFTSKKAEVFTEDQVKKFIDDAPDFQWLDVKVVSIFGICGACRTDEFLHIKVDDVEKHSDSLFYVRLVQTKTKVIRSFTITGAFVPLVQKYIDLRPPNAKERFFVNYQRGKCTIQVMGYKKFSGMPRRIAEYLKISMPERYTGHSFRRTSATILANSGADMETIMRHGAWRNEKCAKGYIEDALHYKQRTGNMITSSILGPSACLSNSVVLPPILGSNSSSENGTGSSVHESNGAHSWSVIDVDTSSVLPANVLHLFDNDVDESELIEVVDRASQQLSDHRSVSHNVQERRNTIKLLSSTHNHEERLPSEVNVRSEASTVLTQHISTKSTSAILPDDFKLFTFQNMHNCNFNFHVKK